MHYEYKLANTITITIRVTQSVSQSVSRRSVGRSVVVGRSVGRSVSESVSLCRLLILSRCLAEYRLLPTEDSVLTELVENVCMLCCTYS